MEQLLAQLPNRELVELALLKMEGHTSAEIAHTWQQAERTVERKLNLIRQIWSQYAPLEDTSPPNGIDNLWQRIDY